MGFPMPIGTSIVNVPLVPDIGAILEHGGASEENEVRITQAGQHGSQPAPMNPPVEAASNLAAVSATRRVPCGTPTAGPSSTGWKWTKPSLGMELHGRARRDETSLLS